MKSKADVAGLALLGLLVLGSLVVALLGYDVGLWMFVFLVGSLVGWVVSYFLTKPRRYRGWVAVALGVGVLLPFLVSVFGLARGIEWLVLDLGFDSIGGAFWFGLNAGIIQVVFGRFSGGGLRAED